MHFDRIRPARHLTAFPGMIEKRRPMSEGNKHVVIMTFLYLSLQQSHSISTGNMFHPGTDKSLPATYQDILRAGHADTLYRMAAASFRNQKDSFLLCPTVLIPVFHRIQQVRYKIVMMMTAPPKSDFSPKGNTCTWSSIPCSSFRHHCDLSGKSYVRKAIFSTGKSPASGSIEGQIFFRKRLSGQPPAGHCYCVEVFFMLHGN